MSRFLFLSLLLFGSSFSQAAVPPYWDQVEKLKAVVESSWLATMDPAGRLNELKEMHPNVFGVIIGVCGYTVKIAPKKLEQPLVGKTTYEVVDIQENGCPRD